MINNSLLTPKRAIYNLLGSICKNPQLLIQDDISLEVRDFEEKIYKILFSAINNIVINNITIKEVTAVDVDNYLASQVQVYKAYEENNGFNFLNSAIDNANESLFKDNYDIIKKFTLLRDFNNEGFDISGIYNPESLDLDAQTKQAQALEKMELQDIVNEVNLRFLKIRNSWNIDGGHRTYEIADGLDTLLEELQTAPDYGHPFFNRYYNTIFRGMRFGKLMIKSASTGVGKTRTALLDIASISASHIYNLETNQYEENGTEYASTFISTELDKMELQTCLIAIISGVSETVIKEGNYSQDIYKRIARAIEILKTSPITLHYINDFSIADIEQIIEKDILEKDTKFVFFDYLQITPKLSRTIQEEYGMGLREDQIMLNFSSRLKNIAEMYNVYICTATQLNRNSKDMENRDASSIRGGSSTIDKADHAIQLYKVTKKDLDMIEPIIKRGFQQPNFMHIIYKNRSGENNLIVWSQMNHGNMREKVLFVTNMEYEVIDMKPKKIEFND